MALVIQTILQAQWTKFFFRQSAIEASLNLVSELGNPLIY
jgi:hypothetical protein